MEYTISTHDARVRDRIVVPTLFTVQEDPKQLNKQIIQAKQQLNSLLETIKRAKHANTDPPDS